MDQQRRKEHKDDVIRIWFDVQLTDAQHNVNGSRPAFVAQMVPAGPGAVVSDEVVVTQMGARRAALRHALRTQAVTVDQG